MQSANATKTIWELRSSIMELALKRMKGQER